MSLTCVKLPCEKVGFNFFADEIFAETKSWWRNEKSKNNRILASEKIVSRAKISSSEKLT